MMSAIGALSTLQNTSRVGAVGMMSGGAQRARGSASPAPGKIDTATISQEARNAAGQANIGKTALNEGAQANATAGIAEYQRIGRGQTGQGGGGTGNCPHSGGGMSMSM